MRRIYLIFPGALIMIVINALQSGGFNNCEVMFPDRSIPTQKAEWVRDFCKTADDQPIFAVRFDVVRKTPSWTAYSLSPAQSEELGTIKRNNEPFIPDINILKEDQANDDSYTGSGFSRGHMVPANDMSWSRTSYDATFEFSNVVPQWQKFNAGTWLGAEKAFRAYVKDKNVTIWNITGVYGVVEGFTGTPDLDGPTIGDAPNTPTVPKCYYKVFAAPADNGAFKVMALLFDWNDGGKQKEWENAVTSLDTIEARTGIDFLSGVKIEANFDAAYWGVDMPAQPGDCQ